MQICESIDLEEVRDYMPRDFITLWSPEPVLVYGGKFELRIDLLEYVCWREAIPVLCVTGEDA